MRLTVEDLELLLGVPFSTKKGRITAVRQFVTCIQWQQHAGIGTAVVASEYGMTAESVRAALDTCGAILAGATPFEAERLLERCAVAVDGQWSALAAVDMALHDLLGQAAGLPLRQMWGLDGLPIPPTAISIGILPDMERVDRARQLADWPIIKLKMNQDGDVGIVGRIREVFPGRIWIDGNGSWDVEHAVVAAQEFHKYDVELLEQPIPRGSPADLRRVRERSPVAIIADEDCVRPADVLALEGCADGINIKLLKCGGLKPAIEMIRLARRLGIKVMLGCKTEGVIGLTAAAQIAGLVDFLDLDGNFLLVDDPYEGLVYDAYRLHLPERPGLGVTLRRGYAQKRPQIA